MTPTIDMLDELAPGADVRKHNFSSVLSPAAMRAIAETINWDADMAVSFHNQFSWDTQPNDKGRLSKRIRRYIYDSRKPTTFSDVALSVAMERATRMSGDNTPVYFRLLDRMEWDAGDCGDTSSCFFTSERMARPILTVNNARFIQFFNANGSVTIGRAIIVPHSSGLLVINAYGNMYQRPDGLLATAYRSGVAAFLAGLIEARLGHAIGMRKLPIDIAGVFVNAGDGWLLYDRNNSGTNHEDEISIDRVVHPNEVSWGVYTLNSKHQHFERGSKYYIKGHDDPGMYGYVNGTLTRKTYRRINGFTYCKAADCDHHGTGVRVLLPSHHPTGYCDRCWSRRHVTDDYTGERLARHLAREVRVATHSSSTWSMRDGHTHRNRHVFTCPGCRSEFLAPGLTPNGSAYCCPECASGLELVEPAIVSLAGSSPEALRAFIDNLTLPIPSEAGQSTGE